ncbi:MAG: hypothetical protein AVDCRST_MAG38-2737, partial [uncultured Solirubrobacteraceae bacterium]
GGHAAQPAALAQRLEPLEDDVLLDAEALGGRREGLLDDRHPALRGADGRDVLLGELDRLELLGRHGLAGGGQRVGALLHLEVHADLEQLQRRQLADRLGPGALLDDVERPLQPERRVRLDADREPHVEVVVAQV